HPRQGIVASPGPQLPGLDAGPSDLLCDAGKFPAGVIFYPEGVRYQSPGSRSAPRDGERSEKRPTPKGLHNGSAPLCNPFGVGDMGVSLVTPGSRSAPRDGERSEKRPTPKGLHNESAPLCNPFGVGDVGVSLVTPGCAARPRALRFNPFGVFNI